jgi:hypothetical protein
MRPALIGCVSWAGPQPVSLKASLQAAHCQYECANLTVQTYRLGDHICFSFGINGRHVVIDCVGGCAGCAG